MTAAVGSLLAACSDGASPPPRLVDGSPAREPPIAFEGIDGPVVSTLVRRRPGTGGCSNVGTVRVERVGAAGASITAYSARQRVLTACDRTGENWCGQAFARVREGTALDPRLSLTCEDGDGKPVGFAWVEPDPGADYVVVAHDGYAEAYHASAGVPVRVTTGDVDATTSRARFDVSEHAADGRRLGAYRLVAQVAG